MTESILVIDQGTTSTRAMIFSQEGKLISVAQKALPQSFPQEAWVEHDPQTIWEDVIGCCKQALQDAKLKATQIAGLGISNQRETTLMWDKLTGEPIYPAIVWQDRRTTPICEHWINQGFGETVQQKTGLLIDPYFSASKIRWLLDHVPDALPRAQKGELAFGTIDTYLIWKFTDGQVHATDATNASRTMMFNINNQMWDSDLLAAFDIPANILPEVKDNSDNFGCLQSDLLGAAIPIVAAAGDQQAAAVGQACFKPGMMKTTYGTGCFMLLNTGDAPVLSKNRLLSTLAYRINGTPTYALEGSIFVAGAAVQWLRDAVHMIKDLSQTQDIAESLDSTHGVYLVPAFTGLGAPYWDPKARGAILGLTRDSGVKHIVRAALESVCYQTRDLWEAMHADGAGELEAMRVDGGMAINDWLMQFVADILGVKVMRPHVTETTAMGIAFLAGLQLGWYKNLDEIAQLWTADQSFSPNMPESQRKKLYHGWLSAVNKIRS